MAVFTAIATAVGGFLATAAGGFLGSTLLGTYVAYGVGYVVAGGIARATAKALGLVPDIPGPGKDPGVTLQLAPSTQNKVSVLYGKAFTSGPIFDAAISNQNQTMTYCIALSEETQTGTFTVSNVFLNDARLIFSGNTVTSHVDPNASAATTYNGKVRVNVYAGGSGSGDQIFPTSGAVSATSIVPHWGANHTANALVFAVVQMDYDAENGLTALPAMTFEMQNSLKNPGDVLYDYLTSDRYGAKLSNTLLDVNSITGTANTEMKGYCDELVSYTNKSNVSTTNARYEINGMISTFNDTKTNIDEICQASATYFTFDVKQGKFRAVPNRAISTAEKANCLVYNDDNIVSKIDISSTELYSLYNGVEVEFADQNRKDQTNTILLETPAGDRNANEPDNVLQYRINLINDNIRAERLANIDLNQSRLATAIQFVSDFSGIQTDVGDVIKITNTLYGWNEKLFRVLRVTEQQDDTGMVTAQITALEYSDDVYGNPAVTETPDLGLIDLPRIPTIKHIPIIEAFTGNYGNLTALPNVYGNIITKESMYNLGSGTLIVDSPSPSATNNTTTFQNLITTREIDLANVDPGDYSFVALAQPYGQVDANVGGFNFGFIANVNVALSNGSVDFYSFGGTGFKTDFNLVDAVKDITIPETAVSGNVLLQGYNDALDTAGSHGYGQMKYDFYRLTKGDEGI